MRVFGLWALCGSLSLGFVARRAVAHLGESASDIGQQMLAWYGGRTTSLPRRININGLEFSLMSATSDDTVHALVERFATKCQEHSGVRLDSSVISQLKKQLTPEIEAMASGVLRQESEEQGLVVCLDTGHPLDPKEWLGRLQKYAKDKNLASFGGLRAMIVRREAARSQLLLLGSEGDMNLGQAFPGTGDAPGKEPQSVLRPPQSRRVLDATEQDAPNGIKMYESERLSEAATLKFYESELPRNGWHLTKGKTPGVMMAELGRRRLLVVVESRRGGGSQTSLIELSK